MRGATGAARTSSPEHSVHMSAVHVCTIGPLPLSCTTWLKHIIPGQSPVLVVVHTCVKGHKQCGAMSRKSKITDRTLQTPQPNLKF